jgi:large subunit ribosomal protein L4
LFGRDYNEALVHQVVVAYMANARSGNRAQKGRARSRSRPQAVASEGYRPRACRYGVQPAVAWRRPDLPELARRELFAQGQSQDVSRRVAAILSQLAREDRWRRRELQRRGAEDRLLAQKLKGMGLESVLVITDEFDENLFLSSRNLHKVLVLEVSDTPIRCRWSITRRCSSPRRAGQDGGGLAMSGFSQERLMQVLLAPQISEKATYIADKNEQVVFKVDSDATKPEVKAAVELLFKVEVESVQILNVKGKVKRFGR